MTNQQIANEILRQMKALDLNLMHCMGFHAPKVIEQGLAFKVNGLSFKGLIEVRLNASDLYDITLTPSNKRSGGPIRTFNGVYFDELMPLLETEVENRDTRSQK